MPGSDDKHDDESGVDWLESQLSDDEPDEAEASETEPGAIGPAEPEPAGRPEPEPTEAEPANEPPEPTPAADERPEPELTEPEPVATGPAATESIPTEPAATEHIPTEPAATERIPTEPAATEQPEPGAAEVEAGAPTEPPGASAIPGETSPESWPVTPVDAQRPPTEDEAATAILDAPVAAQSALPLPVLPPVLPSDDRAPVSTTASPGGPGAYTAAATSPGTAYAPPPAPKPRIPRLLLWILGAIIAVAVLVALFFLGQRLAGGNAPAADPTPTATPSPSATPTPTPTPTPIVGPRAPGVYAWDQLGGGECLQPYVSPWEEEFTVVDCAAPHAAQLVHRGTYAGDGATVYPGEAALASQINLLCSAPGVIDLAAARAFPDLQVQGSFPVTDEQWTSGQRYYYCFVSRAGGEPLTASVAGPGPVAAG